MAKRAKLRVIEHRAGSGITVNDAVAELRILIEDAISFQQEELEEEWALAERYYNGETDLEEFEGRSNVVKTEVRDAIRNTMPSIMRTIMHARKPVVYEPTAVQHGAWVEQQAEYVMRVFCKSDGYMQLYTSVLEALKLKVGPMKVFWDSDPTPEYFKYTKVSFDVIEELIADQLVELKSFEELPQLGNVSLFNVEGYHLHENGRTSIEAVPNYEFFISRNCNSIEHALRQGVHGHRRVVTVAEALEMGLKHKNWDSLSVEDPETKDSQSSSIARRGYVKEAADKVKSEDILRHKFLLTEAYGSFDLDGSGRPQIYRFYFGGTSYELLDHEEVDDSPFALVIPIPIPHTVYGHSMAELVIEEQDTSTSLLRAAVDNAHISNNARIAADPNKTNWDDLMNPALNAPIRKRTGDTIQIIQTPFTGQGIMGLLSYLDQDVQNKVGVTKAAQGLDPDAMQSTDKNAVMNTIMTAQGQTELMVRNIIESALIRVFRLLLKLSVQHMAPMQIMRTKGKIIPIDLRMFDPDASAIPNVGLGTASPLQRQSALTYVLEKQEKYMEQYGVNNPFTSFAQIFNTVEDLLEANGVFNVERYFNIVTPEVEKQWAAMEEKKKQEMAKIQAENAPMDPSKAFIEVEAGKRKVETLKAVGEQRIKERDLSLRALIEGEKIDVARDKLIQDRMLELAALANEKEDSTLNREIEKDQAKNNKKTKPKEADNG